jgi:hypothetical protein
MLHSPAPVAARHVVASSLPSRSGNHARRRAKNTIVAEEPVSEVEAAEDVWRGLQRRPVSVAAAGFAVCGGGRRGGVPG